jgi:hypothetical protein
MNCRLAAALLIAPSFAFLVAPQQMRAATLVGSPFLTGYQNWTDPVPTRGGDWRLNLLNNTVMETSDAAPSVAAPGNSPNPATNNGAYVPALLIQNNYTTPSTYDLNARMWSSDDDGWGLVFGYQDPDNYYRVLFRAQANGNIGGTTGTSVQKIVGGVITQISPAGTGAGNAAFPTLPMIATRQPFDVKVSITGTNYAVYVAGVNGGNPLQSGTDAGLAAGKIGIQSWAQQIGPNTDNPNWGTEAETVSVSDVSGTLYSSNFVSPVKWRPLAMANSNGLRTNDQSNAAIIGDDMGSFGAIVAAPWIYQKTNGFEWATNTVNGKNVDFLGPATVIDEAGSASWSDYEMKVRISSVDDDGVGVIVRAKDNDNFYRINFARQAMLPAQTVANVWERAPKGLSIQKVQGGVWSEIFRDDQNSPLFTFLNGSGTPATGLPKFDLRVRMIGNSFGIQVIDNSGNVIDYPLILDSSGTPILSGTVGFASWGNNDVFYSAYGGDSSAPLLVEVPEPAAVCLTMLGLFMLHGVRSRRRVARLTLAT